MLSTSGSSKSAKLCSPTMRPGLMIPPRLRNEPLEGDKLKLIILCKKELYAKSNNYIMAPEKVFLEVGKCTIGVYFWGLKCVFDRCYAINLLELTPKFDNWSLL